MSDQQTTPTRSAEHRLLNGVIAFVLFFALWPIKDSLPREKDVLIFFLIAVVAVALIYFIYYIVSEGQWKKIVVGILISLAITAASAIFPPLAALAVIYLIWSLFKSAKSILSLLPYFLPSVLYFAVLLAPELPMLHGGADTNAFEVYKNITTDGMLWFTKFQAGQIYLYSFVVASFFCAWASSKPRLKQSLLAVALIWLAVPLVVLIIYSMRAALQNIFKTEIHIRQVDVKQPQSVSSYVRTDGTEVGGYVREVSKTVTEVTTTQAIGVGAVIAGTAETIATGIAKADSDSKKSSSKDSATGEQKD